MDNSKLFESILTESLDDDYEKALGYWVCGNGFYGFDIKKAKRFKKQFKTLYRYITRPYQNPYYDEQGQNVWDMKVGDIFDMTPCSSSTIQFCSKANYKEYIEMMSIFTCDSPDAELLEMAFHDAEGWQIPRKVYDKYYGDSDYSWQKEVIVDGKYRITKITEINDPSRPTLKRRVELEKC